MKKEKNNNKRIVWVVLLAIGVILVGIFIWNAYFNKPYASNDYEAERTVAEQNNEETPNSEEQESPTPETTQEPQQPQPAPSPEVKEETIGKFSTKIYNKEAARQNNINITCNTLNNTVVANGATFSFCNTVGPATTSKGYQKADIFDRSGKKKKGLGGGNCQISSTLYNAVLNIPNINVTERHKHSNTVPYIEKGKDAAVAYGSYDLKFKNNSGNDIKILTSSDGATVTATLMKIN